MFERRSLKWPISLGVAMIVLLVILLAGWVVLALVGTVANSRFASLYWVFLAIGTTFLLLVLVGVLVYLALSVKAINLTRRQSNFIDSVTHELKSPIASLKLYLQTLNRYSVSQEEQGSFYRYMLDDVDRLDRLINHLLDAARLEKHQSAGDVEEVRLDELLPRCAETVCLRYHVPLQTVQLDVAPCVVAARRVDLDLIFRNLVDNAVKYAGADPRVDVIARASPDGNVVIRVTDNGCGIPHSVRRKIFGRFVRLGWELERDKPGTGLGLYIVSTLLRRLRGRIRVFDPDDGPGTVFEVQLPGHAEANPQVCA